MEPGDHLTTCALKAESLEKVFALAGDHTLTLMDSMAR